MSFVQSIGNEPAPAKAFSEMKVLLVEDDDREQKFYYNGLIEMGFRKENILRVYNKDAALIYLRQKQFDLIITDYKLGMDTSEDILREALSLSIPRILQSNHLNTEKKNRLTINYSCVFMDKSKWYGDEHPTQLIASISEAQQIGRSRQ